MRNTMSYRVIYKRRAFVPFFDGNDHLIYWLRTIPSRLAKRSDRTLCAVSEHSQSEDQNTHNQKK